MAERPLGLSDISIYLPRLSISLERIVAHRSAENGALKDKLLKAAASTGQRAFRFPEYWEDPATMAAEALARLLDRARRRTASLGPGGDMDYLSSVRYLAVGTETAVDQSKPISSYVHGMALRAGIGLPATLSNYQVQHACAGGTAALLGVAALVRAAGGAGDRGLVLCSDVARYEAGGSAELTQGAGAVAMLVEEDPRLLELDIRSQGYASADVDDFFRPVGSVTARVKGRYSIGCYLEALETAFLDHSARRGVDPATLLRNTDIFVFHVPFFGMASLAASKLLSTHLGLSGGGVEAFLAERGFPSGIERLRDIGNIYSGSLYLALREQLVERYRALGDGIVGRRVLLASYGSGNTMIVMAARVSQSAPELIASWDGGTEIPGSSDEADTDSYLEWMAPLRGPDAYAAGLDGKRIPAGSFYLAALREDGYREYRRKG